ncbi:DUF4437 domain-containing protein [Nocardiopsis flavescens]
MWDRNDVDFADTHLLPWERVPDGEFGAAGGGVHRVLSTSLSGPARTTVTRVRERQSGTLAADLDLYVLAGSGTLNGAPVGQADYLYLPAGTAVDLAPAVVGLTLYCGFWGAAALLPEEGSAAGAVHLRTEELDWDSPGWSGDVALRPGALVKRLRDDDRAHIYLAAMVPGWRSEMEESHPVYEESYKVYGDILMGARGVMREGSYFFRSPDVYHGPLYSRGGTMSFIRSNAPTTTDYRTPPTGGNWDELAHRAYGD